MLSSSNVPKDHRYNEDHNEVRVKTANESKDAQVYCPDDDVIADVDHGLASRPTHVVW